MCLCRSTSLGAQPLMVGVAISCFSVAQMTFAPIMVGCRRGLAAICAAPLSCGRFIILLIASGSVHGVVAGRVAGVFAGCIPVAQAGVTDILPRNQSALGLSRVAAASQLGIVVGPAASALLQAGFGVMGLAAGRCLPAVFVAAAAFALAVLVQMAALNRRYLGAASSGTRSPSANNERSSKLEGAAPVEGGAEERGDALAQPMLRSITVIIGWTAVLSNSIYGLFAPRFLGFAQPQLSATYSMAAALSVGTQVVFPRLVARMG